jgi:hypothetical protein
MEFVFFWFRIFGFGILNMQKCEKLMSFLNIERLLANCSINKKINGNS